MEKQKGISLLGLVFVLFVIIMVALLGFKLFTPYTQYFTIQKAFQAMAQKPEVKGGTRRDLLAAWQPITVVQNITVLTGDDLEFTKVGNEVVISASYTVKVPLFYNISLVIDFNPTSGSR